MTNRTKWTPAWILGVLTMVGALFSGPAHASDGRIELDQVSAIAGGITAGDGPGFPILISESGSYVLTSDLIVSSVDLTAIVVDADDVAIQLNGHAIRGPVSCTSSGAPANGSTLSCSGTGAGIGVHALPGRDRTSLRGGAITGFGSHGLDLQSECRLHDLHLLSNAAQGVEAVGLCHVRQVVAERNGGTGIDIGSFTNPDSGRSVIHDCVSRVNGGAGINGVGLSVMATITNRNGGNGVTSLQGGLIHEVTASDNGVAGIIVVEGFVSESVATSNDNVGMNLPGSGYNRNVMTGNALAPVVSGVTLSFNVCDGVFSC